MLEVGDRLAAEPGRMTDGTCFCCRLPCTRFHTAQSRPPHPDAIFYLFDSGVWGAHNQLIAPNPGEKIMRCVLPFPYRSDIHRIRVSYQSNKAIWVTRRPKRVDTKYGDVLIWEKCSSP